MSRLNEFCRRIGALIEDAPASEAPARAAAMLPGMLAVRDLLTPAQRTYPTDGYGRHDVFVCPNDTYSVIAAIWPPGIHSPIHDHLTWCALGVYEGVLIETRYEPADGGRAHAVASDVFHHQPGAVAHLPVVGSNIHSMHNPTDRPTITIHIYGGNSIKLGPNIETVYTVEA